MQRPCKSWVRSGFTATVVATVVLAAGFGTAAAADRTAEGLKEALSVGITRAVDVTGRLDGFFKNKAIRIPLPKKLQPVEKVMRTVGAGAQVDEFVLSMNRAAEQAAPEARAIFGSAIKEMTFDDARRILLGGDTAATDYFRAKTTDRLSDAFEPIVQEKLEDVGATRQFQALTRRAQGLPLLGDTVSVDLEDYVVDEALDGLFLMVGREEKRIRRNPAARITSVLREVFGRL